MEQKNRITLECPEIGAGAEKGYEGKETEVKSRMAKSDLPVLGYWNHNAAYYPWVKKKSANCRSILDVGCGDGSQVRFLNDDNKRIIGIDPDLSSIEKAQSADGRGHVTFICSSFEDYTPDETFDAVVFAASLHHMEMEKALQKA